MKLKLIEELSKSRSGRHAVRRLILIVSRHKDVRSAKCSETKLVKSVYSRGWARECVVELGEDEYAVQVYLVKNLYGHVKGVIEVYRSDGTMVFRAVYRRLKLRRSMGDPKYAWIVKLVADYLKLPVKRYNLGVIV